MKSNSYRLWDIHNNKYLTYQDTIRKRIFLSITGEVIQISKKTNTVNDVTSLYLVRDNTGIKDLDNKYVYHKDIVDCFISGLSVVCYRNGSFGLFDEHGFFMTFNLLGGKIKVVGNLDETPHLLD